MWSRVSATSTKASTATGRPDRSIMSGLMSTLMTSGCSSASLPSPTRVSRSSCRSTAASPRNSPRRSLIVRLSICSCAVTSSTGAGRNATSAIASASTPPTPSITIGPNCGSRIIPTMNSRAPDTIGATSSDTSPSSGRAAASNSSAADRTAASSASERRTKPRSVL